MLTASAPSRWAAGPGARAVWARWRFPVCIALIAATLQAAGWSTALRYQAGAVAEGQWWRLLTGNFVHLGWVHLSRDLAALFIIWFGFSRCLGERAWAGLFLCNALAVTLGLYVFAPAVHWYVGLSGILYGCVVCAGMLLWPSRRWLGTVMVLATGAFALYGVLFGPLPGQALGLGGEVIPQAHLFGSLGGALFAVGRLVWRRRVAGARRPGAGRP